MYYWITLIHLFLQLLFSCPPNSNYFCVQVVCGVPIVLATFHIVLVYFSEMFSNIPVAVSHLSFSRESTALFLELESLLEYLTLHMPELILLKRFLWETL